MKLNRIGVSSRRFLRTDQSVNLKPYRTILMAAGLLGSLLAPTAGCSPPVTDTSAGGKPATSVAAPAASELPGQAAADTNGATDGQTTVATDGAPPYAETLSEFNRGAAYMEQYQYAKAARAFLDVLKKEPTWDAARFNLALAYINMAGENEPQKRIGSYDEMLEGAVSTLGSLLNEHPSNSRYLFCLGMIKSYLGDSQQALDCFQRVYEQNPDDNFAAFCYAKALATMDRFDDATPIFEKIVQRDPGFISAVHKLKEMYLRARKVEQAKALLARHEELRKKELAVGAYVVEDKYGMAGKYYFVLGPDGLPLPPPAPVPLRRVLFAPETRKLGSTNTSWDYAGGKVGLAGIAVADIDGDKDLDLLLTGGGGQATLYKNDGKGHFTAGATVADKVVAACFGDIDNDGDADLWCGRAGTDRILLNDGKGGFQEAGDASVAGPDALTPVVRMADIDSDGDLDLMAMHWKAGNIPAGPEATAVASNVWLNKTGDTFVDQASELGLQFPDSPLASIVLDDFDNDFDLDLVAFPAHGSPVGWVNFRAGQYREIGVSDTHLDIDAAYSATSGDPNKDGNRDLLVFTPQGIHLLTNNGHFQFTEDEAFSATCGHLGGTGGQFVDIDNDGDLDILVADANAPRWKSRSGTVAEQLARAQLRGCRTNRCGKPLVCAQRAPGRLVRGGRFYR